jgi:hypothetical protein
VFAGHDSRYLELEEGDMGWRRSLAMLLALASVIVLSSCSRGVGPEEYAWKTHVKDSAGKPAAGARVYFIPIAKGSIKETEIRWEATTDQKGEFDYPPEAKSLDSSVYIYAFKPGLAWGTQTFPKLSISSSFPPDFPNEIVLRPAGSVSGRVVDLPGKPIRGASVLAITSFPRNDGNEEWVGAGWSPFHTTTDQKGEFLIRDLPAGALFELRVGAQGLGEAKFGDILEPGGLKVPQENLEIRLGPVPVSKGHGGPK